MQDPKENEAQYSTGKTASPDHVVIRVLQENQDSRGREVFPGFVTADNVSGGREKILQDLWYNKNEHSP